MSFRTIYENWRTINLLHCTDAEQLRIIRARIKQDPKLEAALLQAGAARLMSTWAREFAVPLPPEVQARQRQKNVQRNQAFKQFVQEDVVKSEKAKHFDRIVEMLDHKMVGNKLLGDCTRADLLRAAVAAETIAKEATIEAGFYRLLAGMIGQGTVRQAGDRGKIVALLTNTFKEAA